MASTWSRGRAIPVGALGLGKTVSFPLPLHPRYVQGEALPEGTVS